MAKLAVPKQKTKQTKDQVEVITLNSENFDHSATFVADRKNMLKRMTMRATGSSHGLRRGYATNFL